MSRLINVKVNPRAKINRVAKDGEGGYIVWTTTVPDKGKANEAVVRALSEFLDLPRSAVKLKRGGTGRRKTFEIDS